MPRPQAAAVAVMALLAFGVIVGSVVRPAAPASGLLLADAPASTTTSQLPSATSAPTPPETEPTPEPSSAPTAAQPAAAPVTAPKQKGGAKSKSPGGEGGGPAPSGALPPIQHVFLIVLSEHGYDEAFGPESPASYLARTLTPQGELLSNYYAATEGALANEIALISGQGPTVQTAEDCPTFANLVETSVAAEEQVVGSGCVYPAQTLTLANQLSSAGKTWKAYVEGVASGPPDQPTTCRHPGIGAPDPDHEASATDPYVTWRNPFVYFGSLVGGSSCAADDVDLSTLAGDLKSATTTPSLAYIAPDRCHDGSEQPCAPGSPAGLAAADAFLHTIVPEIQQSAAYKQGGLIAITFDQAPQAGPRADPSACCETPRYPNLAAAGIYGATGATGVTGVTAPAAGPTSAQGATGATAPSALGGGQVTPTGGGGRVGMLLLSPYVKAGSVNSLGFYNNFSLLRSIEELFHLKRLGYAANPALPAFDKLVYGAPGKRG